MSTSGNALLGPDGFVLPTQLPSVGSLLSTITSVNLKNTGQTTLYTVPAGKTLILTDIIALATTASVVAVVPIIRIGKSASYNEWLPLTTLTGFDTTNKFTSLSVSAALLMHQTFAATEVVKVDVQTGATATTLTASFYCLGFLI